MVPSVPQAGVDRWLDALRAAAERTPDQQIVQVDGDGHQRLRTFHGLRNKPLRVAGGVRSAA